ncbi:MAG: peptidoglycan-binding protein [Christensenellaceae bacterium]|nr:peptidoglycan-binding protein [Christensenellaceae bacterium]
MKKTISVLIAIFMLVFAANPTLAAHGMLPDSGQGSTIYSDNSTGEMVVRIQIRLRELGYITFKPTGAYRSMTVEAVKAFQERCGQFGESIGVDGRMGAQSIGRLFEFTAPQSAIPTSVHMPKGPTSNERQVKGELVSWNTVKTQLTSGRKYRIIDCNTGTEFELVFFGGENHAEMELASEEQLESFDYICGSEYNFLKRPIVVEINGELVAASIQCYPHGADTLSDNGMEGHVCVFFEDSLSHVGSLPDVEHNSNVYSAAGR